VIRILDTNVLLDREIQDVISSFSGCEIIIPLAVIQELNNFKSLDDNRGKNTRIAIRYLDDLRSRGKLHEGIQLENGSSIRIEINNNNVPLPTTLDKTQTDNRILMVTKGLSENHEDVRLITQDICERVIADVLDLKAEDYGEKKAHELYSGYIHVTIDEQEQANWFSNKTLVNYEHITQQIGRALYPNEFIIMHCPDGEMLYGRYIKSKDCIVKLKKESAWSISPIEDNIEQTFLLNLLLDDDIKLVTAVGRAGSGKTLLTLAAGLEKVVNKELYDRLTVTRATIPFGRDIGFLPGSLDEKLNPWMKGIFDNLDFLNRGFASDKKGKSDKNAKKMDFLAEKIELEALAYIRGRSLPYQWIIVDEVQNISKDEVKTIISRVGEGSKLILIGDIEQIDNYRLNDYNNGLVHVVNSFKGQDLYGHVTLVKSERSKLAKLAVELL
jgi:PhoH-like ATPase